MAKRLVHHRMLRPKVDSGAKLTTDERTLLRNEYGKDAMGVSYSDSFRDFVRSPRDTVIGHLIRVWHVGWLVLHYAGADTRNGVHHRIVDVGAGCGELCTVMKSQRLAQGSRLTYTGFELNLERVEVFREDNGITNRHTITSVDLREGIPLPDASQSGVVSTEFLEHVEKPEAEFLLREMHRILEPKGVLVLTTPDRGELTEYKGGCRTYHMYEWSASELKLQLEKTGFEVRDQFWFFVPSKAIVDLLPRMHRDRIHPEWFRHTIGAASGRPGDIQVLVARKR